MRTITAPGVEWKETDRSGYSPAMVGTACFVPGFANKGEAYKPMEFTSRAAWISYYGEPDTEAERYFYAAACEVLNQNGRLYCARLPYDNEAFEQMVGLRYDVKKGTDKISSVMPEIYAEDAEIKEAAVIECTNKPILYSLAQIDEYRTDEAKVPPNSFLIVDTTGATYQKVQEDDRKGEPRELIGIVPVVTTAANALFAQSLINVGLTQTSAYEVIGDRNPIDPEAMNGLNTLNGTYYLRESDLANRLNTCGYFGKQVNTFSTVVIRTFNDGGTTLPDEIGEWYEACQGFVDDHHLTGDYDFSYIGDIKLFVQNASDGKIVVEDTDSLADIKTKCEDIINAFADEGFYKVTDDGKKGDPVAPIDILTKMYSDWSGTSLMFATDSYVNPDTIKIAEDEENEGKYYTYASMQEATALVEPVIKSVNGDTSLPDTLALDANQYFSTIQPANDGVGFDPEHLKDIGVIVYKTYLDASVGNKVSYEAVEAYCGSLYKDDVDPNTGVTKFIDTLINSQSQYINFFSNCFSSTSMKKYYKDTCDILVAEHGQNAILGLYSSMTKEDISVSKSIYDGLNKAFDKITDINERDIDIICDAGIANIASYLKAIFNDKGPYDLTITDDLGNSMLGLWKCTKATDASVKTWKVVEQKFDNFCKNVRKDCMFIADGLRPLVLQGQKKIIRDSKPANTIDVNIVPYLPAICGLNTSYGAGYVDWFEQADDYTGDFFWCPPSIKAMGIYLNTDVNYNYWDAPAGLNRGMVAATDVAFSPTPKQAGIFYEKNWNYAINYPNDGIVLEGQKTFQVKPSAFDRVNVRRLFLRLERASYKVARYFVYEGNTAYLRQRLVDALDPYFKEAKLGGGIYDYKIICDESNNTPTTIDRNELHVSIGIKPVKTAEFIILNFIAGSTGASWEEIMK